jgi:hypothetical protein|eukprot:CAMPEP_0174284192 /NCGR_PEP_ID=MMETSP0809-20121228/4936_1 /TAXON_ID=73025 ORGANISM="Eutreptiella gymnastica-like, Strain CCMP1594" /NCGR_SAMPLE_ID=MMETSP0809 /ASSEMBLY_ACC=CAM_ASM_000658 /LENGTH=150 /DNA_ID=CAMNT_0015379565 /DNA_START=669 /DNA_END=1121 /DNA_ORIENTATION=+
MRMASGTPVGSGTCRPLGHPGGHWIAAGSRCTPKVPLKTHSPPTRAEGPQRVRVASPQSAPTAPASMVFIALGLVLQNAFCADLPLASGTSDVIRRSRILPSRTQPRPVPTEFQMCQDLTEWHTGTGLILRGIQPSCRTQWHAWFCVSTV